MGSFPTSDAAQHLADSITDHLVKAQGNPRYPTNKTQVRHSAFGAILRLGQILNPSGTGLNGWLGER